VPFYKGVLREKEKSPLLTLMKISLPLVLLGIGAQIIMIIMLIIKNIWAFGVRS
jgi:hypothetical protein